MHAQSFENMIGADFTKQFLGNSLAASKKLADENSEELKDQPIPDNLRIPTGDEIRVFKMWEMKYRTDNPKASEREVRRAVQRHFNISIIGGQNMIDENKVQECDATAAK